MTDQSKSEKKHTNTPWEATGSISRNIYHARHDDRSDMMDFATSITAYAPFTENEYGGFEKKDTQVVVRVYGRTETEAKANAAFIVRAANSHYALVEACKAAQRELAHGGDHEASEKLEAALKLAEAE